MSELAKLQEQIHADLGETDDRWFDPSGYKSVALCVLDSIYSIGVNYSGVATLINNYRDLRSASGKDADRDTAGDLVEAVHAAGGADEFAEKTGYRWRTSTRSGILKAEAARQAAEVLKDAQLESIDSVQAAFSSPESQESSAVKQQWLSIRGQGSGLSWDYFLMLAGVQNVKADRMIVRYVSNALGRKVAAHEASELVKQVAGEMSTQPIRLDHAIWRKESGREIYTDIEDEVEVTAAE